MRKSRVPELTVEYLTSRAVEDPNTGCLEWMGARTGRGYGRVGRGNREFYTHRLMWALANGQEEPPPGMDVRHTCDNPPCMAPTHLLIGSHQQNMQDAADRHRVVGSKLRGSQVVTAKLTEAQVSEIKALLRAGHTINGTARQFGVSKTPIRQIAQGRAWKHVE